MNFEEFNKWLDSCDAIEVDEDFVVYPPLFDPEDEDTVLFKDERYASDGITYAKFTKDWAYVPESKLHPASVMAISPDAEEYLIKRLKFC